MNLARVWYQSPAIVVSSSINPLCSFLHLSPKDGGLAGCGGVTPSNVRIIIGNVFEKITIFSYLANGYLQAHKFGFLERYGRYRTVGSRMCAEFGPREFESRLLRITTVQLIPM